MRLGRGIAGSKCITSQATRGNNGIDAETMLYLRNTVIQYMATDRPEVKEQMEGALATVLRFR